MSDFDYDRAESDLYDSGCPYSEEIFEYSTDRGRNDFLRENGLDPDKYYKNGGGNDNSGNSSSSGCFISTACVVSKGLPDDCDELEMLRKFRDSFMQTTPEMKAAVEKYYKIAPKIVTEINKRHDRDIIWNSIYDNLITPCILLIKNCEYSKTFCLYRNFVEELATEYVPNEDNFNA